MITKSILTIAITTALLSGCALGPDFKRPEPVLPETWSAATAAHDTHVASEAVAQALTAQWWEVFHDAELSRLEARVAAENLDVQIASARLAQSRANERIAGAAQLPTVGANASYARELASNNGVTSLSGGSPAGPAQAANGTGTGVAVVPGNKTGSSGAAPFNLWQAGFDASWELDVWGRARRSVEAARAAGQSEEESRRDVLLSTMAEVARDYIDLRGTQSDLSVTRENLATAQDFLRVTQQRKVHGMATELDVASAEAQVSATRELLPHLEQQESETENRLGFLLGLAPGALHDELAQVQAIPPLPTEVPIGIPAEVVRRRPDIRQAEAQLHEATANIGVAKADFYPSITLSGSAGVQALQWSRLGNWGSRQFALGPVLNLPLFEGGQLEGNLQLRTAQQQEAAIAYQRTVLAAWHEVDNALTAYSAEQRRHAEIASTVGHDRRAVDIARARYAGGLVNYLQVLTAERDLLAAQRDLVDSTATMSTNLVALYKALGGGWEAQYPDASSTALADGASVQAAAR